ncbi:MAG TPA: glycosyl hydrolase family 28 protein [Bacillota bacterium]
MLNKANELSVYPVPEKVAVNSDFSVRVRCGGGEWEKLSAYNVKVDMHDVRNASMVYFDFSGTVEVEVVKNTGTVESVMIRPLSFGVRHRQEGNKITFTLNKPGKLSLEVNGDRFHNLHIFAGSPVKNTPDPEASNVLYLKPGIHRPQEILKAISSKNLITGREPEIIYFAPGMHYIEELILSIPSGKTVYIPGGAAVVGSIVCDHVQDVTIRGRGVLYLINVERSSYFRGFRIIFSRNIRIEGIVVIDPPHYSIFIGQSEEVTIKDFKAFSCYGWSDGIDCMSSSKIDIDDVFMRNSDDCIAIYGHRWEFNGDSRNITVKNSVLWADVAHPTLIGTHGDHENNGNVLEDITFENIDILEHHEPQPNYLGCMAINAGDKNTVRHVRYENIRVEQFENGRLFDIRVFKNPDYNPAPGTRIENIHFKDIFYNGIGEHPSRIMGYDDDRVVQDVTVENLRINGKIILDEKSGNIDIGESVYGVVFKR